MDPINILAAMVDAEIMGEAGPALEDDPNVEIRIRGIDTPLWVRRSTLNDGDGPIMREPDHDLSFQDSFAHLCSDGVIRRYHEQIGSIDDIRVVAEKGDG